jgi:hypothetical protein
MRRKKQSTHTAFEVMLVNPPEGNHKKITRKYQLQCATHLHFTACFKIEMTKICLSTDTSSSLAGSVIQDLGKGDLVLHMQIHDQFQRCLYTTCASSIHLWLALASSFAGFCPKPFDLEGWQYDTETEASSRW